MKFVLPLLAVASLRAAVTTRGPVEKVVELLNELKTKVDQNQESEQKVYDKYACWCEKTTQRKANAIDNGKTSIGETTNNILTLKGAIAVLQTEVSELEARIAADQKSIKKMTTLREKSNADYQQEKASVEQALSALHQAVGVLSGAGTGMGLLRVASRVRTAVLDTAVSAALSQEKAEVLKSFLEAPGGAADYLAKKADARASYSPQSATVTGILKQMYDTFAQNLQKANHEESDSQKSFEDLVAAKEAQIKLDQETIDMTKSPAAAEKATELSENEEKLEALNAQLKEDEAFFQTATESCKAKSDDWDERSRLRTEEMSGISEAIKILTSDEARATFAASEDTRPVDTFGSEGVSFVQTSSPTDKAYSELKRAVRATKSLRLANLAATVRLATKGHFDEVFAAIDAMVKTLKAEEAEDIRNRDSCIEERNTNNNKAEDLAYEMKTTKASIERSEEKKAALEADLEGTGEAKVQLEQEMQDAQADREAQNQAFHDAKTDDEKAIELLGKAAETLSKYGSNNAFVQQPEFEVSPDQAPDAKFSDADKHANASKGIVGLLENIQNDIKNEVSLAQKAESKAQADFDDLKAQSEDQVATYEKQIADLNSAIADTDAAITLAENDIADTQKEHDATTTYLEEIRPNCDWIEGAFEKRLEARQTETEGLERAKSILAGSEGGEFGFLQRE